jgi:hypothetical protein
MNVTLVFSPKNKATIDDKLGYFKRVGLLLGSIKDAPLEMEEICMKEISGNRKDVSEIFKQQLMERL